MFEKSTLDELDYSFFSFIVFFRFVLFCLLLVWRFVCFLPSLTFDVVLLKNIFNELFFIV